MLSAIAFKNISSQESLRKAQLISTRSEWIASPDIASIHTVGRHDMYKFYPTSWRDANNRSINLRLREAIGYLTRFPIHPSHYDRPINIAFLPTRSAEEIFTLNHGVYMRVGHEFPDNEAVKFESYLKMIAGSTIRQKRSPTDITEGYDTWRMR